MVLAPMLTLSAQQTPGTGRSPATTAPTSRPASQPAGPRIVEFGPGLRINYIDKQVEVDGEVILREGQLELFAYSKAPAPKEHESIVLLRVKPERIFQALGLLGATPGHPTRYFPETKTVRMASGDPIDVLVRYKAAGQDKMVSACDWMLDARTGKPMGPTHWLFAGSERTEDGAFAANSDGTVVTVVDFPSALLSLPQRHSDSDAELWLTANTPAIPVEKSPVCLILRPMSLRVEVDVTGGTRYRVNGTEVEAESAIKYLESRLAGWADRARVEIRGAARMPGAKREALVQEMRRIGVLASNLIEEGMPAGKTGPSPGRSGESKAR